MHRLKYAIVAFVALAVVTAAGGQANDEAKAILDKAIKAHLPKGKADKKAGYQGKNKGTLHISGLKLEFTQQIWLHSGKFKEVLDMTVMNKAVKVTTVYNGKDGWIKANDMNIDVSKEILAEFKEVGYMSGIGQLTGLRDKGLKLSLLGEVQVNGKPAVGIKVSKEGKKDIDLYFDKATGLMAKIERRAKDFMTGQEATEERIITEYQQVGDRKLAKKVTVNRDGKKLLDAEVVEIQLLDSIDDGEFAQP